MEVRYKSSRREVWRWYWRQWRRRLVWIHILIFVAVVALMLVPAYVQGRVDIRDIERAVVVGVLAVAWLPLAPLVLFKSQERTLTIDERGVDSTIGTQSARRTWKEIKSIDATNHVICFETVAGNAFLIPRRAFADDSQRLHFFAAARQFHASAGRA